MMRNIIRRGIRAVGKGEALESPMLRNGAAVPTYSHDRVVAGIPPAATQEADRKKLREVARGELQRSRRGEGTISVHSGQRFHVFFEFERGCARSRASSSHELVDRPERQPTGCRLRDFSLAPLMCAPLCRPVCITKHAN